ncbi:MAG: hypothetical protein AB7N54_19970 [Alphaproteobacteria bacterium]
MSAFAMHLDVTEVALLGAAWEQAPEMVLEELATGVLEATLLLEREVRERTPTGVGADAGLRGSISGREPEILADQVIGVVGTALAYALPVELGTRPHRPPVGPLIDWARAKFGVDRAEAERIGWAVQRKIAARGTEGAAMFRTGFDANRPQVEAIMARAHQRIVERLAEGSPR